MATAKPTTSIPARRRRRALPWIVLAAVLALVWFWQPMKARVVTATSEGARIACPCRFIAGRELSDCRDDLEPGMGLVLLSEDVEARSVTAWLPLLSSQTAIFQEGQGCVLENWAE